MLGVAHLLMGMPFFGDTVDLENDPRFGLFEKEINDISKNAVRKSAGVEIYPTPRGII